MKLIYLFTYLITFTDDFHPKSEIDRLYMSQANGGRGLKGMKTFFENRTVSISQHLKLNSKRSQLLKHVNEYEQESILRLSQELPRK